MVIRHSNIWMWLLFFATGLLLLKRFAQLSDPLEEVMSGVGIAIVFAFGCTYWWERWKKRQADRSSEAAVTSSDQA